MTALALAPILSTPQTRGGMKVPGGHLRESLGIPADARGIILACGSGVLALYGLALLLSGHWLGLAYLAAGVVSYFFLHGRMVPALVWALVALAGLMTAWTNAAGIVEVLAGLIFGAAALLRPSPLVVLPGETAPEQLQVQVEESAVAPGQEPSSPLSEQRAAVRPGLFVQTIGRFRVLVDGTDFTQQLTRKRTTQFVWTFLLVRALAGHGDIERKDLGEEISIGVPKATQKDRVRRQLWDVANDLPESLVSLIRSDRKRADFDLTACSVDVEELRVLAERVAASHGILSEDLAAEATDFLAGLADGPVLPDFDALIESTNKRRGTAHVNLAEVRTEAALHRAEIAAALADRCTAMGDHAGAVRLLEPHIDKTSRQDFVERLVSAYVRTGRTANANELRGPVDPAGEV